MSEFKLTINGELIDAAEQLEVINPATGEIFATCPAADRSQLEAAVSAARTAFAGWSRTDVKTRATALLRIGEIIEQNIDTLAPLLTSEQGKPLKKAKAELMGCIAWCNQVARLDLPVEILSDTDRHRIELHRKPLGVVGAITPWNFPCILAIWKIAPALMTGNTLVLKPSPFTPLSTLKMGMLIKDALPPGVINIIAGKDQLGQWMTEHDGIQKISFTGSIATGKKIMSSASGNLKRLTLELGGNDAGIILPDADPNAIAEKIFWSAFDNSGQICAALKRLYVHESIYEDLCNALVKVADTVTQGDGMNPQSQLGPIQNKIQFEKLKDLLEHTRNSDANILTGGKVTDQPGYFFPVTIVANVTEGSRLVDEEPFGPILPIIRYKDVNDAIQRANNTSFGLGGSIWTNDLDKGQELAKDLECGSAWVNQHCTITPYAPFGGIKESGMGVEHTRLGLEEFTSVQVLNVSK